MVIVYFFTWHFYVKKKRHEMLMFRAYFSYHTLCFFFMFVSRNRFMPFLCTYELPPGSRIRVSSLDIGNIKRIHLFA